MIYDGYDFSALFRAETPTSRPLLASVNVETESAGRDGEIYKSASLGALSIQVPISIITPVHGVKNQHHLFESTRRAIAGRLWRKKPCKLVLDDAPDVYYLATLSGSTDLDRFVYTGRTTLEFLSPYPYGFGMEQQKECTEGSTICVVGGNTSTFPIVEVETTAAELTVYFDGAPFRVSGIVSGADPVIIDATEEGRSTTRGGATAVVNIFDDYPEWQPGTHTVECSAPYTVRWVERWL